ncbi:cullin-1-like protein isoform X2 [Tanacetum coccineum]
MSCKDFRATCYPQGATGAGDVTALESDEWNWHEARRYTDDLKWKDNRACRVPLGPSIVKPKTNGKRAAYNYKVQLLISRVAQGLDHRLIDEEINQLGRGWRAIDQHFGLMEKLISKMSAEGAAVQGSGWVLDLSFPNFTELHYQPVLNSYLLCKKETKGKAKDPAIALINPEREEEQIVRALLNNVLGIYVEIGMGHNMDIWVKDFEAFHACDSADLLCLVNASNCRLKAFNIIVAAFAVYAVTAHYFEEGNAQLDAKHECRDSTMHAQWNPVTSVKDGGKHHRNKDDIGGKCWKDLCYSTYGYYTHRNQDAI